MFKRYKYHTMQQKIADRFERKKRYPRGRASSRHELFTQPDRKNPFRRENTRAILRQKILIGIGIVSVVAMIGIGIYHPFFRIATIGISGLERINEQEMRDAIYGILDYKKLFILPGNNYFVIDVSEVKDILKERYPIEKITVQKRFPNILNISIEEKISTVIYDNGVEYSYIDLNGHIVEKIRKVGEDEWQVEKTMVTSTNELGILVQEEKILSRTHIPAAAALTAQLGDYPVIYHTGIQQDVVLPPTTIAYIIEWFHVLKNDLHIPLLYALVGETPYHVTLYTADNWYIQASLDQPPSAQADVLKHLLATDVDTTLVQYIDLRFSNRVYWK